jgi:hypothetical protein
MTATLLGVAALALPRVHDRDRGDCRPTGSSWELGSERGRFAGRFRGEHTLVASYSVNERAMARAKRLIASRQYVLDSVWGDVQPRAEDGWIDWSSLA